MLNPHVLEREKREAIRRVLRLPEAAQYEVIATVCTSLGVALSELPIEVDHVIVKRAEALEKIKEAARLLEKPPGVWPTASEFDCLGVELDGWTHKDVAAAWGRWRFAIDELNGGRARPSASQRAVARKAAGPDNEHDAPIACIEQWLDSRPITRTKDCYRGWQRSHNQEAKQGEKLMLSPGRIAELLGIPWTEALRVAEGETSLADAVCSGADSRTTWTTGPHNFVCSTEIGQILGRPREQVYAHMRRHDFPLSVASFGRVKAWLRDDIEAHHDGRPFPSRERGELQSVYLDIHELAELLNIKRNSVRHPRTLTPPPTGMVGRAWYWLKTDVEQWLAERPATPHTGRARRAAAAAAELTS